MHSPVQLSPRAAVRTEIGYEELGRYCLATLRHWPGCEDVAGVKIVRSGPTSRFSLEVTSYGTANRRVANRAAACVEREARRIYILYDMPKRS